MAGCIAVMQVLDNAARSPLRFQMQGNGEVWHNGFNREDVGRISGDPASLLQPARNTDGRQPVQERALLL
jgi:hypothetical protein